ncbi:MAG: glycosyltransferase [Balneolales bacterium]|nr:glycosyltransferase [Balneolales bacterium]
MKRIHYVVSSLSRLGPVQQLYTLVKGLDRRRFDPVVTQLSGPVGESMEEAFRGLDVPVHRLGLQGAAFWLGGRDRFQQHVEQVGADLVHCSGFRADWLGSALSGKVPVVSTVHNIAREDYRFRYGALPGLLMSAVQVRCWSKMRCVVTVSDFLRDDMAVRYAGLRLASVPNGVYEGYGVAGGDAGLVNGASGLAGEASDLAREASERAMPLGRLPGVDDESLPRPVFISLDGFDRVKDPLTVVRAYAQYCAGGGVGALVLLGDGPLKAACIDEARKCGVRTVMLVPERNSDSFISGADGTSAEHTDRVVTDEHSIRVALDGVHDDISDKYSQNVIYFAGRVREVGPWLRVTDVLVSASRSEGFHLGVAEGLCAGLIPVVSAIGVREEMLRGTGFESNTFSVGDVEALRSLMECSANLGDVALSANVCQDRYSVRRMCEGYARVYTEILG